MRTIRQRSIALLFATIALAASATLAACGGSGGGGGSSSGTAGASASPADQPAPKSGCGSYSLRPPPDPQGILAKLGPAYQQAYAGSTTPIQRSAWANWKPSHGPPYTVGIVWNELSNDYQVAQTNYMKSMLSKDPMVGKVMFQATGGVDVGQEIQLFNSMLQKKPDIIIVEPLTGESFTTPANNAAKQGVPTISVMSTIPSKYAVNIHPNDQYNGAVTMAKLMQIIHGKGNVFMMHAIPGETEEINTTTAAKAVLKNCSDVKLIGEAYGSYSAAQAKSETLKFLATHPQKVDAVFQTAVMAPGIMSAFQQVGRPVPPVNDIGNNKASLGYWYQHRGQYHGVAAALGAESGAAANVGVALRMLAGEGIKVTDVQHPSTLVTDKNLGQWAQPGWTLTTPGIADGPPNSFMTDSFLNGLFEHGANPK